MQRLPLDVMLGKAVSELTYTEALPTLFHYIDLCNDQAFLHEQGRISTATWRQWREGIEQNFKRPAFQRAWSEVAAALPDTFDELRRVVPPGRPPGGIV
jgi:hypothetical protein